MMGRMIQSGKESHSEGTYGLVTGQPQLHPAGALRDCEESTSDLSAQVPKKGLFICSSADISSLVLHFFAILSVCM